MGIFPEGVTYNDALMRPMKSGTARMALELEQRHGGQLGLRVVPVGISYSGSSGIGVKCCCSLGNRSA